MAKKTETKKDTIKEMNKIINLLAEYIKKLGKKIFIKDHKMQI